MLYYFQKLEKMSQDLSSAAVMIGPLRVNTLVACQKGLEGRISSGSALFAKIKTIFRDERHHFIQILTSNPLKYRMDNPILIASICMG